MIEIVSERSNIAREEFVCPHCNHKILAGERYCTLIYKEDGITKSIKAHTIYGYCVDWEK